MARVTGVGGIFFKARDAKSLRAWYARHLGLAVEEWGGLSFTGAGTTIWSVFDGDTDYLGAPEKQFMVNFRVDDLDALIADLRAAGCNVDPKTDASEYGKFGWVTDPEGNRVELWQPPAGQ